MMGYQAFRHMSDEDVYSLVAYLNTLAPVRNRVPRSQIAFPVSLLMKSAPRPAGRVPEPDRSNKVKYGEYLVGKDPFPIEHHWNVMLRANHFTGGATPSEGVGC